MSCHLIDASYGKSRVRLTKVTRHGDRYDIRELSVDIQLQGEFDASYLSGDNNRVIATDSMKNMVYVLAANQSLEDIESFAKTVAQHFLDRYQQVHVASVGISEECWERINSKGEPHKHSFVGGNREKRVTHVDAMRGCVTVESGIEDLMVLKTSDSEFCGFVRDEYTTLPETRDRIFATSIEAHWVFKTDAAPFNHTYTTLRRLFLELFAEHHSLSVQQTLYDMGKAALAACEEIEEIRIAMPNQHRIPVDLSRFGLENKNEIFVPIDEPYGLISAVLSRGIRPCMEPAATASGAVRKTTS
jgi:urate oxidase